MAKMVGGDVLGSVHYRGKDHNRNPDGDFDVDDGDVEGMRVFGLRPKGEPAPDEKKK